MHKGRSDLYWTRQALIKSRLLDVVKAVLVLKLTFPFVFKFYEGQTNESAHGSSNWLVNTQHWRFMLLLQIRLGKEASLHYCDSFRNCTKTGSRFRLALLDIQTRANLQS